MELALKYDRVNLGYLSLIFNAADEDDLLGYINSRPTCKYTRRVWFLFEFLTGRDLPIGKLTKDNSGNY